MQFNCLCPDLTQEEFQRLDLKEFDLSGRTFYIAKTPMISHFPVNPEIKIHKTLNEIEKKGIRPVSPLFVMFEDGLLMGSILIEIEKPVCVDSSIRTFGPVTLIGRVFTGPKFLVPKALREFDHFLMSKNITTSEFYFWYHSCKVCEKTRGCRTVILGRIAKEGQKTN